jgi:ethanolamine permease
VLVVLTWFFACGAAHYDQLGTGKVDYPLPLVFKSVWGSGWFLQAFNLVALSGIIVSYNGMLFAISRQSFSLGRAGYLPTILGKVHPTRRTPHVSLIVWTAVAIAFIAFGHFYAQATAVAVLLSTLPALVWYVLAMVCLFMLRKKEPELFRPYKVPVYPLLPVFVAALSGLAAYTYAKTNVNVLLPTAFLYALALAWYFLRGRKSVLPVAPEEVAARIAAKLTGSQPSAFSPQPSSRNTLLERITAFLLIGGLLSLGRMILEAAGWLPSWMMFGHGVLADVGIWSGLFGLVSVVGLVSTRGGKS